MKEKKNIWYLLNKKGVIVLIIFCFLIIGIFGFFLYSYIIVRPYYSKVLPNTYLGKYSISDVSFDSLNSIVDKYSDKILDEKITLLCNNREYSYSYRQLGLKIDKEKVIRQVIQYQNSLSFFELYDDLVNKEKNSFHYLFSYDGDILEKFLYTLKLQTDVVKKDGYLSIDDNRNLRYVDGIDGFSLDVQKCLSILLESFQTMNFTMPISLVGKVDKAINNEQYKSIDTKVSSFTTTFNPYISRATNLKVALDYIDGAIIMPGEIFSFYKYAGPYNKKGYVFYYEYVGNGVCQIATTVYNAALLGGLEIVKRYPHAAKSPYVPGGLDATVASYSSGWNVDFQFKNTYSYPIYVSAYAIGGEAHIDFWSNKDAMGGKTYSTESVQIGRRGYTTYLNTYQNGVWISREKIATTWYSKD